MLRGLEGWHFIIILLVVLVLFGYKRMPDAARSLGRSMRIFKSEVDTMRKDDDKGKKDEPGAPNQPLTGRVVDPPEGQAQPQAQPAPNSESSGDDRR